MKTLTTSDGTLPLLPLRNVVVFPGSVVEIHVGRKRSIAAIHRAIEQDNLLLVCTQKRVDVDTPTTEDLYQVGTVGKVLRLQNLPDNAVKLILQGTDKFTLTELIDHKNLYEGAYTLIESAGETPDKAKMQALFSLLLVRAREYAQTVQQSDRLLEAIDNLEPTLYTLYDFAADMLPLSLEEKYQLLISENTDEMVSKLVGHINHHLEMHKLDEQLQTRVRSQIDRKQREYYLSEQMKALQKEISEIEGGTPDPLEAMADRIKKAKMSQEAQDKAKEEIEKLKSMAPMSSESAVIRNYLDVLIKLPWHKKTKPNYQLDNAWEKLDQDHYGLKDVKERIVEYIAAYKRSKGKVNTPILCLVGPPGVGKTSLAKSIAHAVNRKFIRMSLGGVRDEAEIRGHRRTYIGAMPGRIIQKLTKAEVTNPVFLLDEIDKMGMDFRGDPASALLEVLDPEQNSTFNDHYLEVDYDLSRVMFICTSNSMNIPEALLDRLEIIRIAGYTEMEKFRIARDHLIPQQLATHWCSNDEIQIQDDAVQTLINFYTREAGVRAMQREVAKIIRKSLVKLDSQQKQQATANKKPGPHLVCAADLNEYLGPQPYDDTPPDDGRKPGVVNGLAWTKYGGHLFKVETAVFSGKGEIVITGSIGDVMRESIRAALSVVRARSHWLQLPESFFSKHDFHVHIPEGATPKDGPSAGIALCTALFSLLSGLRVKPKIAMTGELTISGSVLPIGGLKEKLLAAHRSGVATVCIPAKNSKDLVEIPDEVRDGLKIIEVMDVDEVLSESITGFKKSWLAMPQPFVFSNDKESLLRAEHTH